MTQKLYIQVPEDGIWRSSVAKPEFDSLSDDEIVAQGWRNFVFSIRPNVDINKKVELAYDVQQYLVTLSYTVTDKVGEELTEATRSKWSIVREERRNLLANTDYTQMPDYPITDELKTQWATYRQALRDITLQSDPFNLTQPTRPDSLHQNIEVTRV